MFCFDGAPRHGTFETRWAEAQASTRVLGCEAIALRELPETLTDRLAVFDPEHVWAPLPEPDGNAEHNIVGEIAERLWPGRTTFYTTYNAITGRTTVGEPVRTEPSWEQLKRQALRCYESQQVNPATRPHFERGLGEYELTRDVAECRA